MFRLSKASFMFFQQDFHRKLKWTETSGRREIIHDLGNWSTRNVIICDLYKTTTMVTDELKTHLCVASLSGKWWKTKGLICSLCPSAGCNEPFHGFNKAKQVNDWSQTSPNYQFTFHLQNKNNLAKTIKNNYQVITFINLQGFRLFKFHQVKVKSSNLHVFVVQSIRAQRRFRFISVFKNPSVHLDSNHQLMHPKPEATILVRAPNMD